MIEGAPNDTMMLQQQQGEQPPSHPSPSPSFSSYSSETLADIAARVITELRLNQNDIDDDPLFQPWEEEEDQNDNDPFTTRNDNVNNENDDEFEFEFSFPNASSPVSADNIFCNGQIRTTYTYPIFNAPYLNDAVPSVSRVPNSSPNDDQEEAATMRRRLPLRKLMFEERETSSCSSSDDTVEEKLEGVAEGTYCVWNPNAVVARDRKKSNSTGSGSSSKRWKLRELLLRSLSDGKGKKINSCNNNSDDEDKKRGFVFGVPSKRTSRVAAAKPGSGDDGGGSTAERVGKKSVLPYKQELVGVFANVNGLGRHLHPF